MLEPCEGKLSCTVLRGEGGSNTADLPDLLAGEGTDHASAEKNYQTWLAAAEGNYDVQTKEMIACNGQDYTFLSYDCANKDNPYSRGVSAFCVSDHLAVCAELTCKKDYEKDLKELLIDFLNGCHYLE